MCVGEQYVRCMGHASMLLFIFSLRFSVECFDILLKFVQNLDVLMHYLFRSDSSILDASRNLQFFLRLLIMSLRTCKTSHWLASLSKANETRNSPKKSSVSATQIYLLLSRWVDGYECACVLNILFILNQRRMHISIFDKINPKHAPRHYAKLTLGTHLFA